MTRLVIENQGLVHFIAKKFSAFHPLEDLVQEGNLGLLRAARTFDPSKGKWLTYAYGWVRAYVWRFVTKAPQVKHWTGNGRARGLPVISADAPAFDDGDATVLDGLASSDTPADEQLERHQLRQQVREVLERVQFSPLGRAIVEQRLLREKPVILEEVGRQFGVTRERVRQVEVKVRAKLQRFLAPLREESAHV